MQVHLGHSTGITDLAGNALPATTFTSQAYTLSHATPASVMIAGLGIVPQSGGPIPSALVLALAPDSSQPAATVSSQESTRSSSPVAKASPSMVSVPLSAQLDDYWMALSAGIKSSPVGLLDWS